MVRIRLLIALIFCLAKSFGQIQGDVDSLKKVLLSDAADTTLINTRLELASLLYPKNKTEVAIHLSEADELAKGLNDPIILGDVYKAKGNFHLYENRFQDALESFLYAKGFFEKAGDRYRIAVILNHIGRVHLTIGNNYEAIVKFKEVLKITNELKRDDMYQTVFNNLGVAYYNLKNYERAGYYYSQCIIAEEKRGNIESQDYAFYLNNMAEVYEKQGQYSKSRDLLLESVDIQKDLGAISNLSLEYNNLGLIYLHKEDYDSADWYLNKALLVGQDFNNQYDLANTRLLMARSKHQRGKIKQALELAKESQSISSQIGAIPLEIEALKTLSDIFDEKRMHEVAYDYLRRSNQLQDSITLIGNQFDLTQFESDFDTETEIGVYFDGSTDPAVSKSEPFWKQDWFIIGVFFLLTLALMFSFNQIEKRNNKKSKEEFLNVNYLRSNRILFLVAGVFYSIMPFVLSVDSDAIYDPMFIRYAFSLIAFTLYFLTFFSYRVRTNSQIASKVVFILMVAHHFYLIYSNDLAIQMLMYFIILLAGIPAVFRKSVQIGLVSILIGIMSILISLPLAEPLTDPRLFIGVIIALLVVFNVLAASKGDLAQHLEFSSEIVNQADALVFIVNQKGENVFTSQTLRNVLGFEPSEITGHDWIEKLGASKSESNRIKNNLIRIAKGIMKSEYTPYYPLIAKSGETKWISFREKRISQNRVLVIGMDVTRQKKYQDELARSENNFRQINETLSDVFYLFNVEKGEYEYMSPNTSSVLGVKPSFFFDREDYIEEYVHKDDQELVAKSMKKVRNGVPIDIEYRIIENRKIKWIREKSFPVFDENGLIIKKSGLCQNITERKLAEDEIEKLSLIASNTDNFILMINGENRIEWINQSFTKLTGYSEEDILGCLPGEILLGPLTNEKQIDEITASVFERKEQMQCEMITYKKDEEPFYSKLEVTPLLDKDGELEKYFIIGTDITKQKADQEAIEKLSLVASNTSNYVIIAHVDHGIEWVNEAFTSKFGYVLEEVAGRFPSTFLHKNDAQPEMAENINRIVLQKGQNFKGEITHITKDGNDIYANVDITPILNEEGEVEKYFVLGVDITYRKRYEEQIENTNQELIAKEKELQESESNFRELIKSIHEVFWLRDVKQRKLLFVSDSYEEVFGKTTTSLIQDPSSWSSVVHPEDAQRVRYAYDKKAFKGEFNEDYRIVLDNGEEKWVNSRVFPIFDDNGEIARLSGFTEDISLKKKQDLKIQKIADQLDIVHTIEKTILESESTTEIIYNTLDKTLDKLPILRASLALFYEEEQSFYSYAKMKGDKTTATDRKAYDLKDFGLYPTLKEKKGHLIQNLLTKTPKTKTDEILIAEGAKLVMISPLVHRGELLGSLNVCFTEEFQEDTEHYKQVTEEVANGLALAIQQSQLKDQLSRSNRALTASIDYAKMIQQAYIPFDISIPDTIEDNMVINLPKDIVSGDFYWVGESGDERIVVIGDCTGHGVPGAFMTIIGIGAINNIISNKGISDPAEILKRLNMEILSALRTKQNVQLRDGMDIGIFTINKTTGAAKYAGARRPLTILRKNGEIVNVAGTRLSIGDNGAPFGLFYETQNVEVEKGDRFFIYSDGCTDQFGGPRRRKFGKRRLEQVIKESVSLSMHEQEKVIYKAIKDWQGKHYQIDDILFVGFELM